MNKQFSSKQTDSSKVSMRSLASDLGNVHALREVKPEPKDSNHANILGRALDELDEGIAICDKTGKILFRNEHIVSMLEIASYQHIETCFDLVNGIAPKLKNPVNVEKLDQCIKSNLYRKQSGILHFHSERVLEYTCVPDGNNGSVWRFRDITTDYNEKQEMHYQAYHDSLTGLPNRLNLHEKIVQAMRYSQQTQALVGIVYFDLIKFKWVNDTFGHDAGDELLKAVCKRLSHNIRPADTLARVGGDEFVLLIDRADSLEDIQQICNRMLRSFEAPFKVGGSSLRIGTSMGVSVYPIDALSEEELLKHADAAMYEAKHRHISAISYFGSATQ